VRLTALHGFMGASACLHSRARLLQIAEDPDPTVSETALEKLKPSFDREIACDAIHRLVERGCALDCGSDTETVRACSSPSLLRGLRSFMESQVAGTEGWINTFGILVALEDEETDAFLLRPGSSTRDALVHWWDNDDMFSAHPGEVYDFTGVLLARRSLHTPLAEEYRTVLREATDLPSRLWPAVALRAWGEPGLESMLARLASETDGWTRYFPFSHDPELTAIVVDRLLKDQGEETEQYVIETIFDRLLLQPEAVAPELTIPFLRRQAERDPEEWWLVVEARYILARWKIPGGLESLSKALANAEWRGILVSILSEHPESLELDCVRDAFLACIEDYIRDEEASDGAIRNLLDALAERHAHSPIPGAIPVLERIANTSVGGTSRAALRLARWQVPGSWERLAELLDNSCGAYHWSAEERAELPEDMRARLAASE
jgi:hypothetical protein